MRSTYEAARTIVLGFPGVEEGTSYGTPGFRVRGKLFARLHQDGESLVVRAEYDQREVLMQAEPATFFVTDHYRDYPWILAKLESISRPRLAQVLEEAWRLRAPKTLIDAFDTRAVRGK